MTSVDTDPNVGLPLPPGQRVRITPLPEPSRKTGVSGEPAPNAPVRAEDYEPYKPSTSRSDNAVKAEDYEPYVPGKTPVTAPPPGPEPTIGFGEAGAMGVRSAATMGSYPFIKGVAAGVANPRTYGGYEDPNVVPVMGSDPGGGAGMGLPPPPQSKSFNLEDFAKTREQQYAREEIARKQQPVGYIGGELLGGLAIGGAGSAAARTGASTLRTLADHEIAATMNRALEAKTASALETGARGVLGATKAGAAYGAGSGVGETLSSGRLQDLPSNVAIGVGAGGLTGGLLGAAVEGGVRPLIGAMSRSKGADRLASATIKDVWANAGPIQPADVARIRAANPGASTSELRQHVINDWMMRGQRTPTGEPITPEMRAAAMTAGQPFTNLEVGGKETERLAQESADASKAAEKTLADTGEQQFRDRLPNMAAAIDNLTGGRLDKAALEDRARTFNEPNYTHMRKVGDRPIYNDDLHVIASSAAGQRAIPTALAEVKNAAAARGEVADVSTMDNGVGGVIPRNPNIEFWDHFHRALSSQGRDAEGSDLANINRMHETLLRNLDREVPAFRTAREGAGEFLGENSAYEAGRKYATNKGGAEVEDGRRAVARMASINPANRELFARGYATRLLDLLTAPGTTPEAKLAKLDRILSSPDGRVSTEIAMGRTRAVQMEALIRADALIREKYGAYPTSTSSAGHASGHALPMLIAAGAEATHSLPPGVAIGSAVLYGLFRRYAAGVEEKTANEVARLLSSSDPTEVARGVTKAAREPKLMQALRIGTNAASVVAAREPTTSIPAWYALGTEGHRAFAHMFGSQEEHGKPDVPAYLAPTADVK